MDTVASERGGSKIPPVSGAAGSRLYAGIAAFALAAAAARAAAGILEAPGNTFAEPRLMPLLQAAAGHSPYAAPETGPFYVPMYPPLSFLSFAPVLLARSPVPALRIGAACCEAFVLLAAALVLVPGSGARSRSLVLAAFGGFACWLHVSPILTTVFFVHADAPALLLAAAGAGLLLRALGRGGTGSLPASVVLLSLAPWAKQTLLPVVLLPALVLYASERRRALACLAGAAALQAFWAALFGAAFGPRPLAFWILEFSARHPWITAPAEALANANRVLATETAALVAFLAAVVAAARRPGKPWAEILRRPEIVLALAGLLVWPGSLLSYVKAGGAVNSFIPTLFFFSAAGLAALLGRAEDPRGARAALLAVSALLAAQAAFDAAATAHRAAGASWDPDFAFESVRRDPARVWFPWFPLSTYLASGAFVSTELGLSERALAGFTPGREAWEASLPGSVRFVLCGREPCPTALGRFRVAGAREFRRRGTAWTAYEVGLPPNP